MQKFGNSCLVDMQIRLTVQKENKILIVIKKR